MASEHTLLTCLEVCASNRHLDCASLGACGAVAPALRAALAPLVPSLLRALSAARLGVDPEELPAADADWWRRHEAAGARYDDAYAPLAFKAGVMKYANTSAPRRSGHALVELPNGRNRDGGGGDALVLGFGGATDGYQFTNTFFAFALTRHSRWIVRQVPVNDEFSCIVQGHRMRLPWRPERRWLHTMSAIDDEHGEGVLLIAYGGQGTAGAAAPCGLLSDVAIGHAWVENSDGSVGPGVAWVESETVRVRAQRLDGVGGEQPRGRGGHSAVLLPCAAATRPHRHRLLVFGGLVPTVRANDAGLPWAMLGATVTDELWCLALDVKALRSLVSEMLEDDAAAWARVRARGAPPSPRWCHSCVRVGGDGGGDDDDDALCIFGGWRYARGAFVGGGDRDADDEPRRFFNDVHVLSVSRRCAGPDAPDAHGLAPAAAAWSSPRLHGVPPSPRCQAAAFAWPADEKEDGVGLGFVIVYGGAAQSADAAAQSHYGDAVIDMADAHVLDLDLGAWLPRFGGGPSHAPLRGGCNGVLAIAAQADGAGPRLLLHGGMHSDPGADEPDFADDIAELRPSFLFPRGR